MLCHLFSSLKIAFKTQNVSLEVTIEAVKIFRKFHSFFGLTAIELWQQLFFGGGQKEVTSSTKNNNKKIKTNASQATYQDGLFFSTLCDLPRFSCSLDVFIGVWVFHTVREKVAANIPSFSLLMKMCSHITTRRMEKYG